MEIERNSHHAYRIMYHFVWIPKYRHKVFEEPYRNSLKEIIIKAAYDYDMEVEEIEIPGDHVHMLIKAEPAMSPAEIMKVVKSISAREFFKRYPEIQEKYFWGGKLWTGSYFVETVGNKNEEEVRKYVQNQLKKIDKAEEKVRQLKIFCGNVV